jgi:hypothetical protein
MCDFNIGDVVWIKGKITGIHVDKNGNYGYCASPLKDGLIGRIVKDPNKDLNMMRDELTYAKIQNDVLKSNVETINKQYGKCLDRCLHIIKECRKKKRENLELRAQVKILEENLQYPDMKYIRELIDMIILEMEESDNEDEE